MVYLDFPWLLNKTPSIKYRAPRTWLPSRKLTPVCWSSCSLFSLYIFFNATGLQVLSRTARSRISTVHRICQSFMGFSKNSLVVGLTQICARCVCMRNCTALEKSIHVQCAGRFLPLLIVKGSMERVMLVAVGRFLRHLFKDRITRRIVVSNYLLGITCFRSGA